MSDFILFNQALDEFNKLTINKKQKINLKRKILPKKKKTIQNDSKKFLEQNSPRNFFIQKK
jgi:hypothetical protein